MPDLEGFTVGVTADRHRQEQAAMFGRFGIEVVLGATVATQPLSDLEPLVEVTDAVLASPPDFVVASTAGGLRGWLSIATTWGVGDALHAALGQARLAARGPTAAAAARIAGLPLWWVAPNEQLATVGRRLAAEDLRGKRVVVQRDGGPPGDLARFLAALGAEVLEVQTYKWALPADPRPAERLIELCCSGVVDAVTFTAAPAVRHLVQLADGIGAGDELRRAFTSGTVLAACVGPVCAEAAAESGISGAAVPDSWRLGSLVRLVIEHLDGRRRRFVVDGHDLVVQGSVVVVDGLPVRLTDRERAVLDQLLARGGGTVSRPTLLHEVWGGRRVDAHVLETVVARLRAKLGDAGGAVETAVRRGYRFVGDPLPLPAQPSQA